MGMQVFAALLRAVPAAPSRRASNSPCQLWSALCAAADAQNGAAKNKRKKTPAAYSYGGVLCPIREREENQGDDEGRDRGGAWPSGRDETEEERLDRNLGELLQELRVALPGVPVLFAFLLAVPFQQHFTSISEFDKKAYFATLLLTALSAALLIAPSAYHRLTFRYQQKGQHLHRQPGRRSPGSRPWRWR